jgi:hypothetical protein
VKIDGNTRKPAGFCDGLVVIGIVPLPAIEMDLSCQ